MITILAAILAIGSFFGTCIGVVMVSTSVMGEFGIIGLPLGALFAGFVAHRIQAAVMSQVSSKPPMKPPDYSQKEISESSDHLPNSAPDHKV